MTYAELLIEEVRNAQGWTTYRFLHEEWKANKEAEGFTQEELKAVSKAFRIAYERLARKLKCCI